MIDVFHKFTVCEFLPKAVNAGNCEIGVPELHFDGVKIHLGGSLDTVNRRFSLRYRCWLRPYSAAFALSITC